MTKYWAIFIVWAIIVLIINIPLYLALFKKNKKKDWNKLTKKERDWFRTHEDF